MAQHTSYYIAELISNGSMDRVLHRLVDVYRERSKLILSSLEQYMPSGTRAFGGQGGYFIWVELPERLIAQRSASEILEVARTEQYGVHALPGSAFEVPGDERGWGKRWFRLSLSYLSKEEAREGVKLLARAIADSQMTSTS